MKDLGFRWTRPRQGVVDVLGRHPQPLTIHDIHQKLARTGTDLASVYRTVNLLVKHGVAVAVDSVAAGRRYELSDRHREHHHHVVCQRCGTVKDIRDCGLSRIQEAIARSTGFKILHHDLKFIGVCSGCR